MNQAIKKLAFGLIVLFVISAGGNLSAAEQEDSIRVIIGFDESINQEVIDSMEVRHTYEEMNAVAASINEKDREKLQSHPDVKWLEEDQKVQTSAQSEPWGYELTTSSQTKEWGLDGDGVKVAIVDTGIDPDHPDLNVTKAVSVLEDQDSWIDDNGHGTHVAGVIGAKDNEIGTIGLAPRAEIYAVKALDQQGDGWESEIIAGIEWAMEENVDIINLSLTSCQPSTPMKNTMERAESSGTAVVAASGNGVLCSGEYLNDVMFPARYESVVSVGAIDEKQARALFSYGGESLDFVAPGTKVFSSYITTDKYPDGYRNMNGTSMAAPYVSGILALTMQAYPNTDLDGIRELLIDRAVDLGEKGKDFDYGYGLVQSLNKPFADINENRYYYPFIQELYRDGIVKGIKDGVFAPSGEITREEVVTMVGRSIGLDGEKRETPFPDVDASSFGSGFITSAVEKGIIKGFPNGTFAPKQKITRGDVAVIIDRVYDLESDTQTSFPDVSPDCYCYDAVNAVSTAGIVKGYPDGTYRPDKNITRADLATILARAEK